MWSYRYHYNTVHAVGSCPDSTQLGRACSSTLTYPLHSSPLSPVCGLCPGWWELLHMHDRTQPAWRQYSPQHFWERKFEKFTILFLSLSDCINTFFLNWGFLKYILVIRDNSHKTSNMKYSHKSKGFIVELSEKISKFNCRFICLLK